MAMRGTGRSERSILSNISALLEEFHGTFIDSSCRRFKHRAKLRSPSPAPAVPSPPTNCLPAAARDALRKVQVAQLQVLHLGTGDYCRRVGHLCDQVVLGSLDAWCDLVELTYVIDDVLKKSTRAFDMLEGFQAINSDEIKQAIVQFKTAQHIGALFMAVTLSHEAGTLQSDIVAHRLPHMQ